MAVVELCELCFKIIDRSAAVIQGEGCMKENKIRKLESRICRLIQDRHTRFDTNEKRNHMRC